MTVKETRVATEDCPLDCECYDEPSQSLVEVAPRVYTNTNGGSGMSDHIKEMIARKEKKTKELKIVQKKT
jgi:hypothetical protein|tara:strand:+ start:873 stop:1082 length:210 start_codon:yes stop_codon:yes gene_type:complete